MLCFEGIDLKNFWTYRSMVCRGKCLLSLDIYFWSDFEIIWFTISETTESSAPETPATEKKKKKKKKDVDLDESAGAA